jgi:hypothetical protein
MGSESGASSMTGLNSTCVAIDIIFTDGTALHNLTVSDQYGNTLAPASECNHLQPDQWNYVTAKPVSSSPLAWPGTHRIITRSMDSMSPISARISLRIRST